MRNKIELALLLIICCAATLNQISAAPQTDSAQLGGNVGITTATSTEAGSVDYDFLDALLNEREQTHPSVDKPLPGKQLDGNEIDYDFLDTFFGGPSNETDPEFVDVAAADPNVYEALPESQADKQIKDGKLPALDLTAEKNQLMANVENIFRPTAQQRNQLLSAIDNTFQSIINRFSKHNNTEQTTHPVADPNAKSCGQQSECVELWMCKNSTINNNGAYSIHLRPAHNEPQCSYNQVCCHIADKILSRPQAVQPSKMADCGLRHENGVQLTIEDPRHIEANFGEFPWMVAILVMEDPLLIYIGGGSLLAPNVVLTAAHKLTNRTLANFIVRAGEWDQRTTREIFNHQDRTLRLIIMHPHFDGSFNNIALLLLQAPFDPSPHISPICLPTASDRFDHTRCIVTGWGKSTGDTNAYQHILKEVTVPVLPRAECITKLTKVSDTSLIFDPSYICAGGEKGIDACLGDGGAPLACPIPGSPNRYYQAGIVAWGIGCGLENVPAGYTNVPYLMPWVSRELDKLNIDRKYYTP
ncbi:phenoloxidase-activating factor 2-like isoform X2 [Drosophila montana]|uniref:phenoloxidase-activating factor 2-like isoform X2 n=1 Tax=Drosophila montana TaxID=40370 RepID=UPI00313D8B62